MKDSYLTINQQYCAEIKIKASKFIATLFPIDSIKIAEERLDLIKKKYWNASHNCYAYHLNSNQLRYSDDGEPHGTAGKIIFEHIKRQHLEKIMLVVTRYFGGTKLGTGGLIRAYSESSESVISLAEIIVQINRIRLEFIHEYDQTNIIMHHINQFDTIVIETVYADNVKLIIDIRRSETEKFIRKIFDATNGTVQAKIILS